jgi:hypothetical protein
MRRSTKTNLILLLLPLVCLLIGSAVLAQGGDGYDLSWWTVDGGGGRAGAGSPGPYTLDATVGQPDARIWQGSGYTLVGGFWGSSAGQPVNAPPTLSGLPDQLFDHTSSPPGTIDLWAYASDAESAPSELAYTVEGPPPAGAGVTLTDNRYVHVDPSSNWCGYVDVTVRATDPGGLWGSDTFRVAVTWSCQGPLPVANQNALQDEPITLDLTPYEPQVGDGTGLLWYVTGEDHCTVSGEYSADDVLTFTPGAGFLGSDEITLHMVDPWDSEATLDVTLTWGTMFYLPMVVSAY